MKRFGKVVAINIAIFALVLVVVEGLLSYAMFAYQAIAVQPVAERRHTQYDADLGWVNQPNLYIQDMYGPGVYLRTNSQGFRNNQEISTVVPKGKARIICSGDSFTLGYGVDNDHTWCHLLTTVNPGLESVNLGQGGYGVDQAYLWYKRDGVKVEHQVQLLAFITHDFSRMQFDSFEGYGKPFLDVVNNSLSVKNVPVPKRSYYLPQLPQSIAALNDLRTVEFLNRAAQKVGIGKARGDKTGQKQKDEHTRKVLHKIFEDLKRINEQHSSKLVLVYLPTYTDMINGSNPDGPREWTEFLNLEAKSLGVPFINLFSTFSSFSPGELHKFEGQLFHYSATANELVAKVIDDRLMQDPAIRDVFLSRQR